MTQWIPQIWLKYRAILDSQIQLQFSHYNSVRLCWEYYSHASESDCQRGPLTHLLQGFQLGFDERLKVRVRSCLQPRSLFSIAGIPEWSEMGKKWGYSRPSRLAAFVYSQSLVKLPAIPPEDAHLPRRLIYLYYMKGAGSFLLMVKILDILEN